MNVPKIGDVILFQPSEPPYECPLCDMSYWTAYDLGKHIEKKHNIKCNIKERVESKVVSRPVPEAWLPSNQRIKPKPFEPTSRKRKSLKERVVNAIKESWEENYAPTRESLKELKQKLGLVVTPEGEIVEVGTGIVQGHNTYRSDEWSDHREPTAQPIGTFYPSTYTPLDKVNYSILKQIVTDRPITKIEFKPSLSETMTYLWTLPEFREKTLAAIRKAMSNPSYLARQSLVIKEVWSRPAYREKQLKNLMDPERRRKLAEAVRTRQNLPEVKKEMSERTSNLWKDPEMRELMINKIKEAIRDPRIRKKHMKGIRRYQAWRKLPIAMEWLFK